jgi:GntR family transcriptional regulator
MTADNRGLPKWARVAAAVRGQIADGTLRPGQPAPSGAALSRLTGYSTLTCRRALRALVADGVLIPGPSRNARPRVAGGTAPRAERDLAGAARALSAGLAARRRAAGLTQPELSRLACVSVTTIGHAETGRLWQSRRFWDRVDAVLGAHGELLRLHDVYREGAAAGAVTASVITRAAGITGGEEETGGGEVAGMGRGADGAGPAMPASVTIVWGDGTITTVHAPEAS